MSLDRPRPLKPADLVLRSDNGLIFMAKSYRRTAKDYGLEQEYITPYTPEQNGVVERVIRTLKEEYVWLQLFRNLDEAEREITQWIRKYNTYRPHEALGWMSPAEWRESKKTGRVVVQKSGGTVHAHGIAETSAKTSWTDLSFSDQMGILIPALCDVAEMHCKALENIRDQRALVENGWLEEFYAGFGVPLVRPYARWSGAGKHIAGVRRCLQFELMMTGLLAYVKKDNAKLVELSTLYHESLEEIQRSEPVVYPFKQRLGY